VRVSCRSFFDYFIHTQGRSGPPGRPALKRRAGWSSGQVGRHVNFEVGRITYPFNRGRVGKKGREESDGQSLKEEEHKGIKKGTEDWSTDP